MSFIIEFDEAEAGALCTFLQGRYLRQGELRNVRDKLEKRLAPPMATLMVQPVTYGLISHGLVFSCDDPDCRGIVRDVSWAYHEYDMEGDSSGQHFGWVGSEHGDAVGPFTSHYACSCGRVVDIPEIELNW